LRFLELAQRLVGQAGDRPPYVRTDERHRVAALAGELRHGARPLLLDRLVGREHERARADAPDQLDAEQRLARPRRRHDVRAAAAGLAVALERGDGRALVAAPLALEREAVVPAAQRLERRARSCASRSSVSSSNGKPIRWRPWASASTTCAECSSPFSCGWMPNPFHTGASCARVPVRNFIRPTIFCSSRNAMTFLCVSLRGSTDTPIT